MTNYRWSPAVVALCIVPFVGCASTAPEIRRLSPLSDVTPVPPRCQLASVLPGTPAEKAGLKPGDAILKVQGQAPKDASDAADLITKAPSTVNLEVQTASATARMVAVRLNDVRPRLGAVCDLTGWRKTGITAAGNESLTLFDGPYSVTGSGIIDKGVAFVRMRVNNNSSQPLNVGASIFTAFDANHNGLTVLSPHDVMCYLYGDRGAQLLAAKRQHKETLDNDTAPRESTRAVEETCANGAGSGRISAADLQYAQANAEYVAAESLWPTVLKPGETADGLIYLTEPASLPFTVKTTIDGKEFAVAFGAPKPAATVMKTGDLNNFLSQQKKGSPLRVTTKKGKVVIGKFSSYDDIEEKLWVDSTSAGFMASSGIPLSNIRSAEPLEQLPAKPVPSTEHVN